MFLPDHGRPAVQIAKADRAHETRRIAAHGADGIQAGLSIVPRRDEED
jgi:hypothetical protein